MTGKDGESKKHQFFLNRFYVGTQHEKSPAKQHPPHTENTIQKIEQEMLRSQKKEQQLVQKNIQEAWVRKCYELDNQAMVRKTVTREVGAQNLEKFKTSKDLWNQAHQQALEVEKAQVTQ